jgi:cell division protein FtsZ
MYKKGISDVDFVICNTDSQALANSPVPIKIQLGASLTEGLGAGANPEIGEQSAIESAEEINTMFGEKTKMVFITVGMGGGTGTGAAPIIAKMAKKLGLLTIAIVTTPFSFEGATRNEQAQKGIDKLRDNVDSIIVINNNKLREVYGNLGFKSGFSKADEVLSTAAMGIAEVITHHYTQNIDFKDANTVLFNSGSAIMGSATAIGENRSQEAITKALESPLLNDNKITGAKNVLLLIVSGSSEITIDEIGEINDYIQSEAKGNVNIIMGVGEDESLGDSIAVTIVATGFNKAQQTEISKIENKRIVYNLDETATRLESTFVKEDVKNNDKITQEKQEIQKKINTESTEKIVHQLIEDDLNNKGQISLFDIDVNEAEFITQKSIDVVDEEKKGFFNSNFSQEIAEIKNKDIDKELIETTEEIKNIEAVYEIISAEDDLDTTEDDFIITTAIADIEVVDPIEILSEFEEEEEDNQFSIAFEMPLNKKADDIREIEEIELKIDKQNIDEIEVVDSKIVSEKKVYSLDEYIDFETMLTDAQPEDIVETEDEELKFEKKTISTVTNEIVVDKKDVSPLNSTITELKSRADDRRQKMKDFNYKFAAKTKQNIDELEKQPAYKRKNIELKEDSKIQSEQSRTSIDSDGNQIQLRTNNSFLHDTVD